MKTPQVKPSWSTGVYVGDGTVTPEKTSFDVWLRQCDKIVSGKIGVGLHDLADADWRGYYKDEMLRYLDAKAIVPAIGCRAPSGLAAPAFGQGWLNEVFETYNHG